MQTCKLQHAQLLSHVQFLATPRTVACQTLLSLGFSRKEYWSGLPFPPLGNLPNPEIKPMPPLVQEDSLPLSHWGSYCDVCLTLP